MHVYAFAAGTVFLAWQIAIQPFAQRAPVEIAVRVAPGSPQVLRRAAESELAAARNDNAASLGRDALARSPFDVRALRIVGLTEARAGRQNAANEILTLAGNWSLRDDPAHAWLVEHRLRQGDYASSFAHADTLVRRRDDIRPQVFKLFTAAAASDPARVLPVLARLLGTNPPWRHAYLTSLYRTAEGLPTAAALAVMLQGSRSPLTTAELQQFYLGAMEKGQIGMVTTVRAQLDRPAAGALTNGSFDDPTAPEPFQWSLFQRLGANAEVTTDDANASNLALRVEYDGYSTANLAGQRLFLATGHYALHFNTRTESGQPDGLMAWSISCDPGDQTVLSASAVATNANRSRAWTESVLEFSVPQECQTQWLFLRGRPLDHRSPMVVWFDNIEIETSRAPGNRNLSAR